MVFARLILRVLPGVLLACLGQGVLAAPAEAEKVEFYQSQVLPILQEHCIKCHGGEKTRGGLKLTSREAILKGGDIGPAVSIEKPAESLLIKAINYKDEDLQMPPKGKLAPEQIEVMARWVQMGLPFPAGTPAHATSDEHAAPKIDAAALASTLR